MNGANTIGGLLGSSKSLSPYKNPFSKNCIEGIKIELDKYWFGEKGFFWSACVRFKNGETSGRQDFKVDGIDGYDAIVSQVQNFINSL